MNKRYDLCSPRARNNSDKPFWHRVGTAFENDKGITLLFDSLPLPDAEGRVAVMLFEPREQDAGGQRQQQRANDGRGERKQSYNSRDDDIPGWN